MDENGQLDFSDLEVVKNKNLMRSHYNYSALDQKIVSIAFARFDKSKKKCIKEGIRITCNDLMEFLEIDGNNMYAQMHESATHLVSSIIDIYDDEKKAFIVLNLFKKSEYKNGVMQLHFSDDAIACLEAGDVKLRYLLGNFKQLQSRYSIREYEILRSYLEDDSVPYYEKKRKYIEIDLEEFRLMTGTTSTDEKGKKVAKYKNAGDFKIKVLDIADKEINSHTDMNCKYLLIKKGRAYKSVGFWISFKNEDATFQSEIYEAENLQPPNNDIIGVKAVNTTNYDFSMIDSLLKEMPGLKLIQLKTLLDITNVDSIQFVYNYLTQNGNTTNIYQRILEEIQ